LTSPSSSWFVHAIGAIFMEGRIDLSRRLAME
jgi:uncharacterized membrane protein YecN with MAPEG domain